MTAGVIFLDDNCELRQIMVELIETCFGFPCLSVKNLSELQKQREQALTFGLAILDIDLGYQQPSGIDAFEWLKANGFKGQVFFLTGHAQHHPLVIKAREGGAQVWEKPAGSREILKAIEQTFLPQPTEFRQMGFA